MTDTASCYDVLVIGAGPSGSRVACKLAEMRHRVGVLERKENLEDPVCCTGLVSRECVEQFSIPADVIYRWTNSATIFSPSGKPIRIHRDTPQVAVLNRKAFNQLCAVSAQRAGADFIFNCDVRDIEHGRGQAKVSILRHGEVNHLQSKAIVVTTGFGSPLINGLGLGSAGDFVIGAQAEVEMRDIDEVEVFFGSEIAPSFFAWLVPTSEAKALVGLLSRNNARFYLEKLLASLVAKGKITQADGRPTYKGILLQPLPHTHNNNLMVVGTAAGQVKPITGGGIYFGLLCADIAAETLHEALSIDNISDTILAGYENRWRKKIGHEVSVGYWARKIYEKLSDKQIDKVFSLLETTGMVEELCQAKEFTFDWHANVITKVMGRKIFTRAVNSILPTFNSKKTLLS